MGDEARLSFKEMCARFDVTPRTLRHYGISSCCFPEREGPRALFTARARVARMTLILRGRRFGFSLEQIRQWLEMYDADPQGELQRKAWLELADRQLAELDKRRRELDEIIADLRRVARHPRPRVIRRPPVLRSDCCVSPSVSFPDVSSPCKVT